MNCYLLKYWLAYGGQFENLNSAKLRMMIAIPLALITIFILLMAVFHNFKESLLVFTGVPFALSGGLVALWLRDISLSMPTCWIYCFIWCCCT